MKGVIVLTMALAVWGCSTKSEKKQEEKPLELISEVLDVEHFKLKAESTPGAILLDVRTAEEMAEGYIEGARNIDFRQPDFEAKISGLDKEATYLVYCAAGTRSGKTAKLMHDLKFKKVYDLKGGFTAWQAQGFPTVKDQP